MVKKIQVVDHVIVTDEIRGNKIDSYMAYFVESNLITNELITIVFMLFNKGNMHKPMQRSLMDRL